MGAEFGQNMIRKTSVICKAFTVSSQVERHCAHLAATLHDLQYQSSLADPDVWLQPNVKKNEELYYEYVIVYVDDILVIAKQPKNTMDCLAKLPAIDEKHVIKQDWTEFYHDAKEPIPPNAPEPRGKFVMVSCFVDANHAGDRIMRRSHTGIIIIVNHAPIIWYSKQQNTIETITFGSEFVAA